MSISGFYIQGLHLASRELPVAGLLSSEIGFAGAITLGLPVPLYVTGRADTLVHFGRAVAQTEIPLSGH
jgi:hypothetical protein